MKELNEAKKLAEAQESTANFLYEERLKEKNTEIDDKGKEIRNKEKEILTLKEEIIQLESQLNIVSGKVKGVQTLVKTYDEQIIRQTGKSNPTLQLINEELDSIPQEDSSVNNSNDRILQTQELLKEKEKLEEQLNQLKWDVENEVSKTRKTEQERDKISRELKKVGKEKKNLCSQKDEIIQELEMQIASKLNKIKLMEEHNEESKKYCQELETVRSKLEKVLEKYRDFCRKIWSHFEYKETLDITVEQSQRPLLEGLFDHISLQKNKSCQLLSKAESKIKELESNAQDRSEAETTTEQNNELLLQLQDKENDIQNLNSSLTTLNTKIEQDQILNKEKAEEFAKQLQEKNNLILNHTQTLETMKKNILDMRDNLEKTFKENEAKEKEIESLKKQIEDENSWENEKLSLLSTINSHLNAVGIESDEEFVNEMPDFDTLFSIVVDKIK